MNQEKRTGSRIKAVMEKTICVILAVVMVVTMAEFFGGADRAAAKDTTATAKQSATANNTTATVQQSETAGKTTSAKNKTATAKKKTTSKKKKRPSEKKLIRALGKPSGRSVKSFNSETNISKLKSGKKLKAYVKKLRRQHYKVSFVVIDINTGEGFSCDPKRKLWSASCLKAPYVAALCKYKPKTYKKEKGLMRRTIIVSDNDAFTTLRRRYGKGPMKKIRNETNAKSFKSHRRYAYIKTRDLGRLWVGIYWYFFRKKNSNSKKCRKMYTHSTQSFIRGAMKGKYTVYTKPGWYPGEGLNVQNDAGIVMAKYKGKSSPYVVAIMTTAYGEHKKLRHLTKLIDKVHRDMYKRAQ